MARWGLFGSRDEFEPNTPSRAPGKKPTPSRELVREIERVRSEASREVEQLKDFLRDRTRQVAQRETELALEQRKLGEQAARLRRRRDALRADKRRRARVLARLDERRERDDVAKREHALQLERDRLDTRARELEVREQRLAEQLAELTRREAGSAAPTAPERPRTHRPAVEPAEEKVS